MLRLSTFVATGLSAFVPIIHAVTIFPYAQLTQQTGLGYYLVEGLALITGVIFYAVSASAQPGKAMSTELITE